MSEEVAPDAVVSYKVGDLLNEIKAGVQEIDRKVDSKVEKADLAPIVSQLANHHDRLQKIEDDRKAEAAVKAAAKTTRRWAAGFFTAVVVPLGGTMLYIFH